MTAVSDHELRTQISTLLNSGLVTDIFPRADSHEDVHKLVNELQLAGNDLNSKLLIAGFTPYPVEHGGVCQLCETCMYYKVHRRYCELPELDVPVEPHWSCRLWRI
ncbi:hypothetical protein [Bradyrhizobium iriomotense]|uniref:Uncharacterized protein n=1 Tax=Bradyrhizobium iriomotense TaxID=441950 RepID=A0ABQ6ARD3_9BRAD|nr:hypothetical protein [Bradyrhizobium iriomotense]GLR83761.1 hypothetical protein GCM10007857_04710 [Bradyrhizobium iriomotense]